MIPIASIRTRWFFDNALPATLCSCRKMRPTWIPIARRSLSTVTTLPPPCGSNGADLDINDLIKFHKSHGKMVTMTAVRPSARFGELNIQGGQVLAFEEKPQLQQGWINGGYFVVEPSFLDLIEHDDIMLEREPLMKATSMGQLMAYQHEGFWQCMDTKREHDLLENLWSNDLAPWQR